MISGSTKHIWLKLRGSDNEYLSIYDPTGSLVIAGPDNGMHDLTAQMTGEYVLESSNNINQGWVGSYSFSIENGNPAVIPSYGLFNDYTFYVSSSNRVFVGSENNPTMSVINCNTNTNDVLFYSTVASGHNHGFVYSPVQDKVYAVLSFQGGPTSEFVDVVLQETTTSGSIGSVISSSIQTAGQNSYMAYDSKNDRILISGARTFTSNGRPNIEVIDCATTASLMSGSLLQNGHGLKDVAYCSSSNEYWIMTANTGFGFSKVFIMNADTFAMTTSSFSGSTNNTVISYVQEIDRILVEDYNNNIVVVNPATQTVERTLPMLTVGNFEGAVCDLCSNRLLVAQYGMGVTALNATTYDLEYVFSFGLSLHYNQSPAYNSRTSDTYVVSRDVNGEFAEIRIIPSNKMTTGSAYPYPPTYLNLVDFTTSSITLTWIDNALNEDGFYLYRQSTTGSLYELFDIFATNVTGTIISAPDSTSLYNYKVQAFNAVGTSSFSNVLKGVSGHQPPPAAPSNFAASQSLIGTSSLTWTDNSTDETNFYITRTWVGGTDGVNGSLTASANAVAADDAPPITTTPDGTTQYQYAIRSVSPYGESANVTSNTITMYGPPAPPSQLVIESGSIILIWSSSIYPNDTIIEKSTGGSYTQIYTASYGTTSYVDTNVTDSNTNIYRYRAFSSNIGGTSSYSTESIVSFSPATAVWKNNFESSSCRTFYINSGSGMFGMTHSYLNSPCNITSIEAYTTIFNTGPAYYITASIPWDNWGNLFLHSAPQPPYDPYDTVQCTMSINNVVSPDIGSFGGVSSSSVLLAPNTNNTIGRIESSSINEITISIRCVSAPASPYLATTSNGALTIRPLAHP